MENNITTLEQLLAIIVLAIAKGERAVEAYEAERGFALLGAERKQAIRQAEDAYLKEEGLNVLNLPTFGGKPPVEIQEAGVYSWDAERLLVEDDGKWRIESRPLRLTARSMKLFARGNRLMDEGDEATGSTLVEKSFWVDKLIAKGLYRKADELLCSDDGEAEASESEADPVEPTDHCSAAEWWRERGDESEACYRPANEV